MAPDERISPSSAERVAITVTFDRDHLKLLGKLPWHMPLASWGKKDARFLSVRSGLSRHLVRFVTIRNRSYAVKETSLEMAEREYHAYTRLAALGIPTLIPIGTVERVDGVIPVETPTGQQYEPNTIGYLVTGLLEFALPDSYLFRRAFSLGNRRRIWDAIIRLFVQLHCNGVYWGDATLSNMMIHFVRKKYPEIGARTILRAVLADAETVEFQKGLSQQMRRADVDYFLESMLWMEADMKASGTLRDPLMTKSDQDYILNRYLDLYEVEKEEQSFELITNIDIDALLGEFQARGQSRALLQHIYEHRWYLSERVNREISVEEAAHDWYASVFKPVVRLFAEFEILDEFPDKTATSLYLEIMLHKYYLSERMGRDVGLIAAFEDYAMKFAGNESATRKLARLANSIRKHFSAEPQATL